MEQGLPGAASYGREDTHHWRQAGLPAWGDDVGRLPAAGIWSRRQWLLWPNARQPPRRIRIDPNGRSPTLYGGASAVESPVPALRAALAYHTSLFSRRSPR